MTSAYRNAIKHIFIILLGLIMLYPIFWMLGSSFKPDYLIFTDQSVWPAEWTMNNYSQGWFAIRNIQFGTFFVNSFIISVICVLGSLISCSMAAYAFAKLNFPLKAFWFSLMMLTIMLPEHVKLIPQYVMFHHLDWVGTILPLTVPKWLATEAFFVFLMVQFMRGLPKELDESATVDGCGWGQIYWKIVIPLATPALISTAIFSFIWSWDDFFSQLLYLNKAESFTVPLGLRLFLDSAGESMWGALFAMSVLALLPKILLYFSFQRHFVEGIATTGIKG